METHKILFLAANPSETDRLELEREASSILKALRGSSFRDHFEFRTQWAAQPPSLLRELSKIKPTIVHFSGHGGRKLGGKQERAPSRDVVGESELQDDQGPFSLFFQDDAGRARAVSTDVLAETFDAAGRSVKLVVLNACYTEAHAEALLPHVDCIVGMTGSILDEAARRFATGFYGGLGDGASVEEAYKHGKAAMSLEGLRDGNRPQLKVRDGVDPSQVFLTAHPPASRRAPSAPAIIHRKPEPDRREFLKQIARTMTTVAGETTNAVATVTRQIMKPTVRMRDQDLAWKSLENPHRPPTPDLDEIFGKCTHLDLVVGNDHPRVPRGILHPDIFDAQKLWADCLLRDDCRLVERDELPAPRADASQILLGGPISNPSSRDLHGIVREGDGFRSLNTTKLRWTPYYPPTQSEDAPAFRRYLEGNLVDSLPKYIVDHHVAEEYSRLGTKKDLDSLLIEEDLLVVTCVTNKRNPAEFIFDILELHSQGHKAFARALLDDAFRREFWSEISVGRRKPARAYQLLYRVPVHHDRDTRLTSPGLPVLSDKQILE